MSPETRELITWTLGTILATAAVVGLVGKWILLPYLREHLVKPVAHVREQVQNSHSTNLRDDIDALRSSVDEAVTEARAARVEMRAVAAMYEGHVQWSERWVALMERELDALRDSRDRGSR